MKRGSRIVASTGAAVLLVVVAISCAIRWFGIAFTAGEGLEEPPQVCDAACHQQWKVYGDTSTKWLVFGGAALAASVACAYSSLKTTKPVEIN